MFVKSYNRENSMPIMLKIYRGLLLGVFLPAYCVCAQDADQNVTTYTVGGNQGWSKGINYDDWAANITFNVGDSLRFVFDNSTYDLVEVNRDGYKNCYTTDVTYLNGNMTFILTEAKTYYYICTKGTLCSASGMKIAVTSGTSPPNSNSKRLIIILTVVGAVITLVVTSVIGWIYFKLKRKDAPFYEWEAKLQQSAVWRFSYSELSAATKGFSEEEVLGRGGFGKVYKGVLASDGSLLAIKVMSQDVEGQFLAELDVIGRLKHKNLVGLRGWCHHANKLLLAYDYMENGSLDRYLFSTDKFLPWSNRYEIVKGVAEGLAFLHGGWEQRIVHRDIKAANVLLDTKFVPHLGDFGLAKLLGDTKFQETMTQAGTPGYMAPELALTGRADEKCDIFSFGILLLEVGCGRRIISDKGGHTYLLEWVWQAHQRNELVQVVDPRLRDDYNHEEMVVVLSLGLLAAHPDAELRPSSRQCCLVLNGEDSLPPLPSSIPTVSLSYGFSAFALHSESGTSPSREFSTSSAISSTKSRRSVPLLQG